MSPTTTGIASSPTFSRTLAAIGAESSMPLTGTPRSARGTATRPVPIASSSAGPSPARSASRSTVGRSTSGANMSAAASSYRSASSSSHRSLLVTRPTQPPPPQPVERFHADPPLVDGGSASGDAADARDEDGAEDADGEGD